MFYKYISEMATFASGSDGTSGSSFACSGSGGRSATLYEKIFTKWIAPFAAIVGEAQVIWEGKGLHLLRVDPDGREHWEEDVLLDAIDIEWIWGMDEDEWVLLWKKGYWDEGCGYYVVGNTLWHAPGIHIDA